MVNGYPRVLTDKETRAAEQELRLLMRSKWRGKPLDNALRVELVFFIAKPKSVNRPYPSVRPDADNFAKLVMDCGNGILWMDDSQIVDLRVRKEYGEPSIKLVIGAM